MTLIKVGIIIPTTTSGKVFDTVLDTEFVNIFLKSLLKTYNTNNSNIICSVYLGYDFDDPIYSKETNRDIVIDFLQKMDNKLTLRFIEFDKSIEKGHLTKMWNILSDVAYNDKCDYIYHCGDDIEFITENWLMSSIELLKKNNDIGISGPIVSNHNSLLTQALFSRRHIDIFGVLFEDKIKNWYVDDWYNLLYSPKNVFVDFNHLCNNNNQNVGVNSSYNIIYFNYDDIVKYADEYKNKLNKYIVI